MRLIPLSQSHKLCMHTQVGQLYAYIHSVAHTWTRNAITEDHMLTTLMACLERTEQDQVTWQPVITTPLPVVLTILTIQR